MVFAYADPPYPGTAAKYYRLEPTYAGEVDHRALVASLLQERYAGWALSTSSKALRDVLPLRRSSSSAAVGDGRACGTGCAPSRPAAGGR